MEENDMVEGKKELSVLISSSLMAKLMEREEDYGDVPFDTIVEWLLTEGFAFREVFKEGYVRLSSVRSLMRDFYSTVKGAVVDEEEFIKAVGVGEYAETGV